MDQNARGVTAPSWWGSTSVSGNSHNLHQKLQDPTDSICEETWGNSRSEITPNLIQTQNSSISWLWLGRPIYRDLAYSKNSDHLDPENLGARYQGTSESFLLWQRILRLSLWLIFHNTPYFLGVRGMYLNQCYQNRADSAKSTDRTDLQGKYGRINGTK